MSVFKGIETRLDTAKRDLETFADQIQENYQANSTPTASFLAEVQGLTCPARLSASPKEKRHALFSAPELRPWRTVTEASLAMVPGFPSGIVSSLLFLASAEEKLSTEKIPKIRGLDQLFEANTEGGITPELQRAKLMRLAWLTGVERNRVEREMGPSHAIPLLIVEARIAIAMGDKPRAEELNDHLLKNLREAATARGLLPLQTLVESGAFNAKDLEANRAFFSIVPSSDCGPKLAATPFFFQLSGPEQREKLQEMVRLGLIAQHRVLAGQALLASDEPRRLYHEAHIALLQGNSAKSRVLLMDFKEKTQGDQDPEITLMRTEARETLRSFSLQEIEQLIAFNEGITEQRKGNRYGWTIEAKLSGESQSLSLERMKSFLERGQVDTLEEAYALTKSKGQLGKIRGAIVPLFMMGTREGLERLSEPKSRKRYLLEVVEQINTREGSYAIAGQMLEDVFQDELRKALAECPKDRLEAIRAEVDRENIEAEVQKGREVMAAALDAQLAASKPTDSQPNAEQRQGLLDEMIAAEVDRRVALQVGFQLLSEHHASGELEHRDPLADKAWEIYNDTFDPLDEIFNVSHATGEALKKEALFTVVTLPAGLGAGVLARSWMGGTSLVVRLSAQGGFRAIAAEGMVVGAGALAEGLASLSLNTTLKGEELTAGKAGLEFLSNLVGAGAGRFWARASKALKMDPELLEEVVKKGGSRAELAGLKIGAFAGPTSIYMANATLFGEIGIYFNEEPVTTSFTERLFGTALKALINPKLEKTFHLLTGKRLEAMDEQVWKDFELGRQRFLNREGSHPLFEMGQAASSLNDAGWTKEEILKFLEMDPSLAPLVLPPQDKIEDLMAELRPTPDGK